MAGFAFGGVNPIGKACICHLGSEKRKNRVFLIPKVVLSVNYLVFSISCVLFLKVKRVFYLKRLFPVIFTPGYPYSFGSGDPSNRT
jgi:hypothetical protein